MIESGKSRVQLLDENVVLRQFLYRFKIGDCWCANGLTINQRSHSDLCKEITRFLLGLDCIGEDLDD